MWISADVEIPDRLLQAQQEGRLVIFAGAGVSIDSPSGMPSFRGLVEDLATEHGADPPLWYQDQPDAYLGLIASEGFKVHDRVAEILTPTGGATFNAYHTDLLHFFRDAREVRIITTNHDPFFTLAAESIYGHVIESFFAPALPLGDDFVGIVYLHGGIARRPDRLVLTDSDFGRAYLAQGWATTFLRGLYSEFDVLFVGYSHGEPVLRYLARGLSSRFARFAIDRLNGDVKRWEHLGIEMVGYPTGEPDDIHSALRAAIAAWAERTQMGSIEHDAQVRALARAGPPIDPPDNDYLRLALRSAPTVMAFASEARDPSWLTWIRDAEQFKALFRPGYADAAATELAQWFAQVFVIEQSDDALSTIVEMGGTVSSTLWIACAHRIWTADPRPEPNVLAAWAQLLIEKLPPEERTTYLEYILQKCRWPEDRSLALVLFSFLTDPRTVVEPRLVALAGGGGPSVTVSVGIRGDSHALRRVWQSYFLPNLGDFAADLEPILAAQLARAHTILKAAGQADDNWDPSSFLRYRIEQ